VRDKHKNVAMSEKGLFINARLSKDMCMVLLVSWLTLLRSELTIHIDSDVKKEDAYVTGKFKSQGYSAGITGRPLHITCRGRADVVQALLTNIRLVGELSGVTSAVHVPSPQLTVNKHVCVCFV
jgi:hypothetical protein